jgi:hypothetical protein
MLRLIFIDYGENKRESKLSAFSWYWGGANGGHDPLRPNFFSFISKVLIQIY